MTVQPKSSGSSNDNFMIGHDSMGLETIENFHTLRGISFLKHPKLLILSITDRSKLRLLHWLLLILLICIFSCLGSGEWIIDCQSDLLWPVSLIHLSCWSLWWVFFFFVVAIPFQFPSNCLAFVYDYSWIPGCCTRVRSGAFAKMHISDVPGFCAMSLSLRCSSSICLEHHNAA